MGINVNNVFPSNYVKASDLQGREHTLTIASAAMERMGDDNRLVIYFTGGKKGLMLNKTNASNIDHMYGPDTDAWIGKTITLFPAWVDFQGKTVEAVRVKPVAMANSQQHQQAANAQAPLGAPPSSAPARNAAADLDDTIPF